MNLRVSFNRVLSSLYNRDEIAVLWRRTLSWVCQIDISKTYFIDEQDITPLQQEQISKVAQRLSAGEPLEYITGFAEFCSMNFKVTPSVLIPRLETQEIVHLIKENHNSTQHLDILDIGTGSGCIAVTLAKHFKNSTVTAVDISAEALLVAKQNAEAFDVNNITFVQTDFLSVISGKNGVSESSVISEKMFDIIVTNPPYVRPSEIPTIPPRVLNYEPHTALFVPEEDPLIFYRAASEFGKRHLRRNGTIYAEINQWLGPQTQQLFLSSGYDVELLNDSFSEPRFVVASLH